MSAAEAIKYAGDADESERLRPIETGILSSAEAMDEGVTLKAGLRPGMAGEEACEG